MRVPTHPLRVGVALFCFSVGWFAPADNAFAQVVRKDINTLKATDQVIVSWVKAIDAMKRLPATDPHNWIFQANIHAVAMNGTVDSTRDTCQHGQWYFMPWHRAYLCFFEKIIQTRSGDPTFALPYWNWTAAGSRNLPALHRDNTSQLFDRKRGATVNDGTKKVDDAWMTTDFPAAMARTDFFTNDPALVLKTFGGLMVPGPVHFQGAFGALESSPHNNIHVWFEAGSDMINPRTAAQDPAFWSHHCMIDKTWEDWLAQGGGRANPVDAGWTDQTFEFYDENKKKVKVAVKDFLDTKKCGYTYGPAPMARALPLEKRNAAQASLSFPVSNSRRVFVESQDTSKKQEKKGVSVKGKKNRTVAEKEFDKPVVLGKKPFRVVLKLSAEEKAKFAKLVGKEISINTFGLELDGVTFGDAPDPKHKEMVDADSTILVFLNAPADAKLDTKSPYYVGNWAPFGPVQNKLAPVSLTGMEKLRKEKGFKDDGEIRVTLVRAWGGVVGVQPAEVKTPLTFKKIRFVVME